MVSRKTAPGRLGNRTSSTPVFPGARPRRRTRARSLNTVTSAMGAATSGALSADFGDSTTPGTLSAAASGTGRVAPNASAATTIARGGRRALNSSSFAAA